MVSLVRGRPATQPRPARLAVNGRAGRTKPSKPPPGVNAAEAAP
jgi:hypothetical protein